MSKQDKEVVFPEKRFPEFSALEGWQLATIGQHLKESRTKGNKGDTAKKLTVKLWGNGVYKKNESLKGSPNTQYYRRKAGQFIYSKLDFLNQAFGIIPEHLDNYESTVDLPCFDVGSELDARFLLEYVQREDFYKTFGEIADGGRKAKRIQVDTFLNFPIYLPKLEEQQKVADCLSSVDELIAAEEQKLNDLKTHKNGLMQQLFPADGEAVPKRRFPEFKDKEEWACSKLGQIASIRSGSTPLRSKLEFYENGDIPWVKTTDLNNSFIKDTEECITSKSNPRINPEGSVLVAMYGGFNQIGRTGLLKVPAATNQALSVLNTDASLILPIYLLMWLNAKVGDWKKIASSSRKDPNITGSDVASFQIWYPSLEEQQRISDILTSVEQLISNQSSKVENLKAHKKGLMQKLFPSMEEVGL